MPFDWITAGIANPLTLIDREQTEKKSRQILMTMPEVYRAVLLWRYWDHRSLAEMAALSGKSVKSIERLLARARTDFGRRWRHG